jgi:hypothetical protein
MFNESIKIRAVVLVRSGLIETVCNKKLSAEQVGAYLDHHLFE